MRRIVIILLGIAHSLCGCQTTNNGQQPQSYIDEMIALMRTHSLYRKRIDWKLFEENVKAKASGAHSIPDTYPAIQLALTLLGDRHSKYITADGQLIQGLDSVTSFVDHTVSVPAIPRIGYIRIPPFSGNQSAGIAFANAIQARIKQMDSDSIKGWIVDLRDNTGGDFWPMLAGIGPILGNGLVGYFLDPNGMYYAWSYQDGIVRQDQKIQLTVVSPYTLYRPNPKVAVLTNRSTASSAEGIAICFKNRPKTRSFGSPTYGLPTANGVLMMSDGASLVLTQVRMVDRNKITYEKWVVPDDPLDYSATEVGRALFWLIQP